MSGVVIEAAMVRTTVGEGAVDMTVTLAISYVLVKVLARRDGVSSRKGDYQAKGAGILIATRISMTTRVGAWK
jgi:hypothetical protein